MAHLFQQMQRKALRLAQRLPGVTHVTEINDAASV
jgi:hypothetical protein